jgi:flagellar biosynthesis protein FlhF
MNVRRFTARTSREALRQVREALGEDAVVLSTKPAGTGVEVLAMAPEGMRQVEELASTTLPQVRLEGSRAAEEAPRSTQEDTAQTTVEQDVSRLSMSTLSFQDYVRTRMLKRRKASLQGEADPTFAHRTEREAINLDVDDPIEFPGERSASPAEIYAAAAASHEHAKAALAAAEERRAESGLLGQRMAEGAGPARAAAPAAITADPIREADAAGDHAGLMAELRSMKGLIEERFSALAFMEKLQRRPGEARLTQRLLDCGFSPALIKKLASGLTDDTGDETAWATQVLERNLRAGEADIGIDSQGGVFALIGATGVGKTTTTAKIAAAFAARHGASNLGLITLDAYRVGAHEQLRAYGRILGVPVHTAHDRASLEDLLELLGAKKMVLIDTAGMAQRDSRTRELLDMLSHRSIQRLLIVNAASQGETIEDVLVAYKAASCAGIVLSKLDEAVKLGPALDAAIRHKLKIVGVANGQRVPEDWHRLSASALVQRALRGGGSAAWRFDAADMNLVFAAPHGSSAAAAAAA